MWEWMRWRIHVHEDGFTARWRRDGCLGCGGSLRGRAAREGKVSAQSGQEQTIKRGRGEEFRQGKLRTGGFRNGSFVESTSCRVSQRSPIERSSTTALERRAD